MAGAAAGLTPTEGVFVSSEQHCLLDRGRRLGLSVETQEVVGEHLNVPGCVLKVVPPPGDSRSENPFAGHPPAFVSHFAQLPDETVHVQPMSSVQSVCHGVHQKAHGYDPDAVYKS